MAGGIYDDSIVHARRDAEIPKSKDGNKKVKKGVLDTILRDHLTWYFTWMPY